MDTTVPDITVERITPPPRSGRAGKRVNRTTAAVAPKRATNRRLDERGARRAAACRGYDMIVKVTQITSATEVEKFADVDLSIVLCFRCLPDAFERRTFRRYAKAENTLYLDMSFSEEAFGTLDEDEQERHVAAFRSATSNRASRSTASAISTSRAS